MKKKPPRDLNGILGTQFDDDMTNRTITSATDVTGMIARPPMNEGEVEGYLSLFHVEQQAAKPAQKADTPAEQEKNSAD